MEIDTKPMVEAALAVMAKRYPGVRHNPMRNDMKAIVKRIAPMIEHAIREADKTSATTPGREG